MPVAFAIRSATVDDASAMGECMVRSWLDAHDGQMPDEMIALRRSTWTPETSADAWQRLLGEIAATTGHPASVRLAVSGTERVVGIGMATVGQQAAEVNALYVVTEMQHMGVGRALLRELARVAARDGADSVEVVVLAANAPARAFYEHLGGEMCGEGDVDEEGTPLPSVMYRWPIDRLVDARPHRHE